ncbi:MAG: hypothetical protein HC831_01920 [Chloroflexia bacterium]|nr:hypothetical protein [Chloroflexia bacterium]
MNYSDILKTSINTLKTFPTVAKLISARESRNQHMYGVSARIKNSRRKGNEVLMAIRIELDFRDDKNFPNQKEDLIIDLSWSSETNFSLVGVLEVPNL